MKPTAFVTLNTSARTTIGTKLLSRTGVRARVWDGYVDVGGGGGSDDGVA